MSIKKQKTIQNHHQKGSAAIIAFIVLFLTFGGAIWYFKSFPLANVPAGQSQVEGKKEAAINIIPKENPEIALWQTYKNMKYGYGAVSYIQKNSGGSSGGNTFVFHKPHVLEIVFTYRPDNKKEKYEMTQILSTFKFIE